VSELIFILGIHDGHNCGATLTRNGRVMASISEERLSRSKNETGYPKLSIDEVLRIGGINPSELKQAVYSSLFMHGTGYLDNVEPWYTVGISDQRTDDARPKEYQKLIFDQRKEERIDIVCDHLGIQRGQIDFLEHHLCHLAAAFYTAPNVDVDRPTLGFTADGAGDNIAGSVSICTNNEINRIATIDRHASLGKIYSRITLLQGMTPWEHEYKLMGMAPYADPGRTEKATAALRDLLKMSDDGLAFEQAGELSTHYCYEFLRDNFERVRFDVVAGAAQQYTEEVLVEWVRSAIKKTGISDIVCGGGVFMNVKANMLIADMPEVTSMYVMPSAADESLSIGACLHRYYELSGKDDHTESVLENLYLGGEYGRADEEKAIAELLKDHDVTISEPEDVDIQVADMLAEGKVVARCAGRMEWGARALGNRSILTTANDFRVVDRINRAIKMRDFWMPFAPSIRAESASRYYDDPKSLNPHFMMHAFEAKAENQEDLVAGSHPRDQTIRPQKVTKEGNPGYHKLISWFEDKTGRGVVLNTSFNLHGFPIVYSPADAIDVLLRSGLEHLALNHFIISKSEATQTA
jgi:carbamoyltransferase